MGTLMGDDPSYAWTDDDGLRWYTFEGNDYLSVTSMRKVLGLPYRLHNWIIGQMVSGIVSNPMAATFLAGDTEDDVKRRVRALGTGKRDAAADLGTKVHAAIAEGTSVRDVPAELVPWLEMYAQAVTHYGIQPLYLERQVFSTKWGYAGSFDQLSYVKKYDEVMVIDLKSGKGTYPEHAIQGLSYLRGDFVAAIPQPGTPDRVDDEATQALQSATGVGILHVTPEGYDLKRVKVDARLEAAFRAQAILARFYSTVDGIEDLLITE